MWERWARSMLSSAAATSLLGLPTCQSIKMKQNAKSSFLLSHVPHVEYFKYPSVPMGGTDIEYFHRTRKFWIHSDDFDCSNQSLPQGKHYL